MVILIYKYNEVKLYLLLFLIFLSHTVFCQNTYPSSGSVVFDKDYWHQSSEGRMRIYFANFGATYFGTNYGYVFRNNTDNDIVQITNSGDISMAGKLKLITPFNTNPNPNNTSADIPYNFISFYNGGTSGFENAKIEAFYGQNEYVDRGGLKFYTKGGADGLLKPQLTINSGGYVGIGTASPSQKLEVYSATGNNGLMLKRANTTQDNLIFFNNGDDIKYWLGSPNWQDGGNGFGLFSDDRSKFVFHVNPASEDFNLLPFGGNVLIGTPLLPSANYKLNVAGNIRANKLVVNTTGADFVFDSSYQLLPLTQLEKFIKANKHLPQIAPAKDMLENGVDVGENQTKLLQKIEELTLYLIEQNKKSTELSEKLKALESKLEKLISDKK